ncbi:MAG: rhomboid family intramembrane serine protease [Methanophagales archaeon]|nr:rhomboid family intramembrane serine protease [Methanophagales archaeon]
MARTQCTICGKPASYRCKYCGDTLCREHLAPDKHWCVALEEYKKGIEAGRTSSISSGFKPEYGRWEYKKRVHTNLLGIFAGNYSFLILFLISISFVLQLLIPRPYYTELLILNPTLVMERPWTLVTHLFLHGSFEHFFINMLVFFFFAPVLERKIGSSKFLLIFFLAGIFAGIGWSLTSVSPAVGASGALMGIFATLAVLMPRMRVYLFFIVPLEIWVVVILFALYDFFMIGSGDMIAHTAHLSGLFFGLLAGMWLKS